MRFDPGATDITEADLGTFSTRWVSPRSISQLL